MAECSVLFYEDSLKTGTGLIKGTLRTGWKLSKANKVSYDAIMLVADGFSNNEFTGTWKSYHRKTIKKCNWGDFRIPGCGDMDIGVGEFSVNDKYLKNGWQTYRDQYDDSHPVIQQKAQAEEEREWWK